MITLNKGTGIYMQCNFCLSRKDIYEISHHNAPLVVSMCNECLKTIIKAKISGT